MFIAEVVIVFKPVTTAELTNPVCPRALPAQQAARARSERRSGRVRFRISVQCSVFRPTPIKTSSRTTKPVCAAAAGW